MPAKTVSVTATMGEKFKIESRIRDHHVVIDQPKQAGGEDAGPTPLEFVFFSLAGCIGSIGRIIAHQKKINLRGMQITVEGSLNTDVLLGKSQEHRVGFESVKVTAKIDADMSLDEKKQFLAEIESRCPVSDNLSNATPVTCEVVE